MAETVRTRFAPSPTGYLHVGAARTALFAWLWARHNNGEFYLRIEDTDQARKVDDAEKQIKEALQWLGLDWDGPVVHQSERKDTGVYKKYAQQLIDAGHAYRAMEEQGEVVRFKWPEQPPELTVTYFDSANRQETRRFNKSDSPSAFEDFVLIKSDGYPTYNFAHVIDDYEAGITDIIRGDEFIPSLNKYVTLYDVFDWPRPRYIHVPTIVGPDKQKLSKRHGAKDILDYRTGGFLPTALANFIALIGWSPGQDQELFFSLEDLIQAFSLDGLQKSPGVFDEKKLRWMNKEHMKQLDIPELLELAKAGGFWKDVPGIDQAAVFELALERTDTLSELTVADYYTQRPKLNAKQITDNQNPETVAVWLEKTQRYLESVTVWDADRLKTALDDLRNQLDLLPKQLYPVLRRAVTGAEQTPALWDVFAVLGQAETLARLESAAALVS